MISGRDWGIVILFALAPLAINEIIKLFSRVKKDKGTF